MFLLFLLFLFGVRLSYFDSIFLFVNLSIIIIAFIFDNPLGKFYYEVHLIRCDNVAQLGWADINFNPSSRKGRGIGIILRY
jgi:hypothetical protein